MATESLEMQRLRTLIRQEASNQVEEMLRRVRDVLWGERDGDAVKVANAIDDVLNNNDR